MEKDVIIPAIARLGLRLPPESARGLFNRAFTREMGAYLISEEKLMQLSLDEVREIENIILEEAKERKLHVDTENTVLGLVVRWWPQRGQYGHSASTAPTQSDRRDA